ncbi:MAG TPA: ATP-binding protein [Clostridia bacterium]|nr:ATP-binding protein [Clostridia bacterium]
MRITSGTIEAAQKVVVYGPEGIGKSTFASKFPDPLFIDTEGSTKRLNVHRTPRPTSWTMLMELAREVRNNPSLCKTLVIDTADWAEQLCANELVSKAQKTGMEDFGYGKGYVYLAEDFGRILNLLEEIVERGVHVVVTAHATMRKFEQPDEQGAYDRWEMKLQKKTAALLKEWADMVLFANYRTYVVNVDGQGARKGKNKTQEGGRVMYTSHRSCWDAKNRHDLPDELRFEFSEIAQFFSTGQRSEPPAIAVTNSQDGVELRLTLPPTDAPKADEPTQAHNAEQAPAPVKEEELASTPTALQPPISADVPRHLSDLMKANGVLEAEIQTAVASKGYYPFDTPIKNYDPNFVSGVLVGAWPQVFEMIKNQRANGDLPF